MRYFFLLCLFIMSCKEGGNEVEETKSIFKEKDVNKTKENVIQKEINDASYFLPYTKEEIITFKDSTFVVLHKIDSTFSYDIKYATKDNFLSEVVYDCDDCLLRYETVKHLLKAHEEFKKRGYRIHFFDCYRPLEVQKKMWEIFPDKRYVANPNQGSNHNRGTAVDITLIDSLGNKLAMGTNFDYFGREAHHAYQNLPDQVLQNRKLLKTIMEKHGFWSITSEWWHYNLNNSHKHKVSNFKTTCD